MADSQTNISGQLQMADILEPNATLSAFTLEMDEQTTKILDKAKQLQQEILKLKAVDENLLRMVVQL